MSTIDTSTWSPDSDLNVDIGGIPLNSDASIAQTWQAIQMLMAALKGDTAAIELTINQPDGTTIVATNQTLTVVDNGHAHTIANVTGLQTALNGKASNASMAGATASADGASGLVPAPQAGDENKVLKGDGTWDGIPATNLGTVSRAVQTDANGDIAVSNVTSTELGHLSGVTSNVQTQLDAKAGTAAATQSAAGLMSAADKAKLDGLPTVSEMGAGYIRYSNGLQMCFETVEIKTGTTTSSLDSSGNVYYGIKTVTFPKAFSAPPVVTLGGHDGGTGFYNATVETVTASDVKIEVYGRNSNVTCTPGYFAIGQWA